MNRSTCLLLLCVVPLFYSCHSKPALETEENAIRDLLARERKAHFGRDVDLFVSEFSDSMISVNKGRVTVTTPGENKQWIQTYFSKVRFIGWDDVAEPMIRFSEDRSLAYAVIRKQVILSYPDSLGKPLVDTTDYAWVSVYRKKRGEWKIEANISTNK